jgi:hypothetical protein
VVFQLATRARTLTEFDSINLAKALRDFDVSKDQPHAPGYPLAVGEPFLSTTRVVRSQDRETRKFKVLARECLPPGCTVVSLPGSPLTWNHVASAMQGWYAPRSDVRDLDRLSATTAPSGAALWVGARIPAPVVERARLDASAGYWRFYRSSPFETKAIVRELVG